MGAKPKALVDLAPGGIGVLGVRGLHGCAIEEGVSLVGILAGALPVPLACFAALEFLFWMCGYRIDFGAKAAHDARPLPIGSQHSHDAGHGRPAIRPLEKSPDPMNADDGARRPGAEQRRPDPSPTERDSVQADDAARVSAPGEPPKRPGLLPEGYTWPSVLVEVAIVVAGVLVAFALNSWWQGRIASEREQAHLRALHADFRENVRRLEAYVDQEQRTMEASRALLALLKEGEAPPPDTTRRLLGQVFDSGRFQPVMGAYEALLGSGGLSLISDGSLRTALAAFASMSENRYHTWLANEYYVSFNRSVIAELHSSGFLDPATDVPFMHGFSSRPN